MAEELAETDSPQGKPKPGKKAPDHTGPIIVVVSIIGVIIAWVSYKRQAANGSLAQMVPTSGTGAGGAVAGSGLSTGNNSGLDQLITNLGDLVTQLQTPVSGTVGSPIADNHPVYKRFLFGNNLDVYSIENGNAQLLTAQQWTALGRPAFDTVTTQDSDYALVQHANGASGATVSTGSTGTRPATVTPALPVTGLPARTVKPS